ncbi:hypothetical protein ATCC90586_011760 [Pythium insidiosum]|nr:hypothetical protein ATCC90586_011760 [Pythium insidiosum]
MVTELQAWSLLEKHCDVFRGVLYFDVANDLLHVGSHGRATLRIPATVTTEMVVTTKLGCRLRLAVDLVNALSSCRGCDPERHSAFWRRVVAKLWVDATYPQTFAIPGHAMMPFDATTFSSFQVEIDSAESEQGRDVATIISQVWRQFVMIEAYEDVAAIRAAELKSLLASAGGTWAYPLRPLSIRFAIPPLQPPDKDRSWLRLEQTIAEIADSLETSEVSDTLREIELYLLVDPSLPVHWLHASDLLALHRIARQSPRLVLRDFSALLCCRSDADHHEMLVQLGALLRLLAFEALSLRRLTFFHSQFISPDLVGAVWSIVAHAPTLREINVRFRDHHYARDETHRRHIVSWMIYAMHEATRTLETCLLPDFDLHLLPTSDHSSSFPLKAVAEETVREYGRPAEWHKTGTRVTLNAGTALYAKPFVHGVSGVDVVAIVHSSIELPLVVSMDSTGWLGVVMPGSGLCWATSRTARRHHTEPPLPSRSGIHSLCLLHAGPGAFQVLTTMLDPSAITSLSLSLRFPSDLLPCVLSSCPQLTHLGLQDDASAVTPLLQAYEAGTCSVRSLVLTTDRIRPAAETRPLFRALSDQSTRVSQTLRGLWLDNVAADESVVWSIQQLLRCNSTLSRLHVSMNASVGSQPFAAALVDLEPFGDTLLVDPQTIATRLAFLSVLPETEFARRRAFDALVCSRILAFAAPFVFRRISWASEWRRMRLSSFRNALMGSTASQWIEDATADRAVD